MSFSRGSSFSLWGRQQRAKWKMAAETGSLALGDLPGDLLTVALRFVDHRTLLRLERVNLQLRSVITQFGESFFPPKCLVT